MSTRTVRIIKAGPAAAVGPVVARQVADAFRAVEAARAAGDDVGRAGILEVDQDVALELARAGVVEDSAAFLAQFAGEAVAEVVLEAAPPEPAPAGELVAGEVVTVPDGPDLGSSAGGFVDDAGAAAPAHEGGE